MNKTTLTRSIKAKSIELGFDDCGIAVAQPLEKTRTFITDWLSKGYNGNMQFLERNLEKRINPKLLVKNAQSVIVCLINYYPEKVSKKTTIPRISKYVYGADYHKIIKKKLNQLLDFIRKKTVVNGRAFVDTAPVLEKEWAVRAGLAWHGKNTILISKTIGSFFFLGELIVDIPLDYDQPFTDNFCGNCTKCLDACPTKALVAPKILDARRCISYHTIENRSEIPNNLREKFQGFIYGCDICQDVCPWNSKSKPHTTSEFKPHPKLLKMKKNDWLHLSKEEFDELFIDTEIKRGGYMLLKRNLQFIDKKKRRS